MKFRKLSELKEALQNELENDFDSVADRRWKDAVIEEVFDRAVKDTARRDGLIEDEPKKDYVVRIEDEWI